LLSEEQMRRVRAKLADGTPAVEPRSLIEELVERGWLTAWQGKMLLAGQKGFFLGRYKLLDQLGQGGQGTVFKAEHVNLRRIVALKVMAPQLLRKPEAVARFHREIQAAAALNHPNIVTAYDADCVRDTHFLVMEYAAGQTLERFLRGGRRLPPPQACDYIRQAALGLAHAHERGMVHRDIKPSNLLVALPADSKDKTDDTRSVVDRGVVKILDMGLARLTGETGDEGDLTRTGQIMGTPDYIAPEQARNTHEADIRSDIFSLGCTLFRALTGTLPYAGQSVMEKLMARGLDDAPRIRSIRPEISAELDAIVAKMLARQPADRYQTPDEVARALEPFTRDAAAVVVAGPAAIVAAEASAPADSNLARFLDRLATEAEEGPSTTGETLRGEAEGKTHAALEGARAERRPPVLPARPRALRRHDSAKKRGAWALWGATGLGAALCAAVIVWNQSAGTELVIRWNPDEREGVVLNVDGRERRLSAGDAGQLSVAGGSGRRTLKASRKGYITIEREWNLSRGERAEFALDWEPAASTRRGQEWDELRRAVEEQRAAATRDGAADDNVAVASLRERLTEFHRRNPGTADAISAAEALRALPSPTDRFDRDSIDPYELSTAGGELRDGAPRELVGIIGGTRWRHPKEIRDFSVSHDGRFAVTSCEDRKVRIWDATTGRLLRIAPRRAAVHTPVAMGGRPAWAAAGMDDRSIQVWNAETGDEVARLTGPPGLPLPHPAALALSRDGRTLVCGGADGSVRVWDVATRTLSHELRGHHGPVVALVLDEERNTLISGSDPRQRGSVPDTKVAERERGPAVGEETLISWDLATGARKLSSSATMVGGLALSGDGNWLAVAGSDHVLIRDPTDYRELARLSTETGDVRSLAFDSRTKLLYGVYSHYQVLAWETDTWKQIAGPALRPRPVRLAFLSDGRILAVSCHHDICLWDCVERQELAGREPFIESFAQSPDGHTLATGGDDGSVTVRDLTHKNGGRSFQLPGISVAALAFSTDGKKLAGATSNPGAPGSGDGPLRIWNVETGREVCAVNNPGKVMTLAFSRDDRALIVGDFMGKISFHDAATGERRQVVDASMGPDDRREIFSLAISPDGRSFATGSWFFEKATRVWDWKTKREKFILKGHSHNVHSVAWSPDGLYVVSGSADETARLWDAATGRAVRTLHYRTGGIEGVAVDPQNTRVAVGGFDGGVSIITLPQGEPIAEFVLPGSAGVAQVEFTPDGRHLLTRNRMGTMYVLRLETR
jgi:WD40 repeat protein/tRNA A-37 threonylcarbamoyl transferase component Bud32